MVTKYMIYCISHQKDSSTILSLLVHANIKRPEITPVLGLEMFL